MSVLYCLVKMITVLFPHSVKMCVLLFYFKTLAVRFFSDFSFSLISFCSVTCFKNLEHFSKSDDIVVVVVVFISCVTVSVLL